MRVVIADDSVLWREGLAALLEAAAVEVVALAGDGASLEVAVAEHAPDVALIDIRMPPTWTHEGAETAGRLAHRWPGLGRLLLSQTIESREAAALARAHPSGFGYLLKDRVLDVSTLVDALTTVAAGGTVLDPEVMTALLGQRDTAARLDRLTARERDVLSGMGEGRSNSAIGRDLHLTTKTVESHIASIFGKLDLAPAPDDHRRVRAVLAWLEG